MWHVAATILGRVPSFRFWLHQFGVGLKGTSEALILGGVMPLSLRVSNPIKGSSVC